jgi:hypothetical protein
MHRSIEKPWFRRRAIGFGWRPVSWEGWALTVAVAAAVVGVLALMRGSAARVPVVVLILAVYTIVALATGGTRDARR